MSPTYANTLPFRRKDPLKSPASLRIAVKDLKDPRTQGLISSHQRSQREVRTGSQIEIQLMPSGRFGSSTPTRGGH